MPNPQPKPASAASARVSIPRQFDCPTHRAAADARSAVMEASDGLECIKDAHQAYEALELLITPVMRHDCEQLEVTRSQLGQLMRVINRNIREQIEATSQAIRAAKEST